MNWHVLYTQPRNEKKVAEKLESIGLEVYCPTVVTLKQWSDRRKKVIEPLFKSYVFIHISENARHLVFQISGVKNYLFFEGSPAIVRDQEIIAIKAFCGEVKDKELQVSVESGEIIQVNSGPFKGLNGKYLTRKGNQLILLVESLGQLIKAEIPIQHVCV